MLLRLHNVWMNDFRTLSSITYIRTYIYIYYNYKYIYKINNIDLL